MDFSILCKHNCTIFVALHRSIEWRARVERTSAVFLRFTFVGFDALFTSKSRIIASPHLP